MPVVKKKKLEQLIPRGNLAVYHNLRRLNLDYGNNASLSMGFKIADGIEGRLNILKNRGFIAEQQSAVIFDRLVKAFCQSAPTAKLIANKRFLRKRGNQRDWNLNLFIYLTVSDLKNYTGKPNFGAIAEHLKTSEIYGRNDEPLTAKAVEDMYKRVKKKDVIFFLDLLSFSGIEVIPFEMLRNYDKEGFLYSEFLVARLRDMQIVS